MPPGSIRVNKGCPPPVVNDGGKRVEVPPRDDETLHVGLGNLTQALWEIETWIRSVRQTLEQLPPDTCIPDPPQGIFAYDPCGCRPGEKTAVGDECVEGKAEVFKTETS
jgi:hypothetical protein